MEKQTKILGMAGKKHTDAAKRKISESQKLRYAHYRQAVNEEEIRNANAQFDPVVCSSLEEVTGLKQEICTDLFKLMAKFQHLYSLEKQIYKTSFISKEKEPDDDNKLKHRINAALKQEINNMLKQNKDETD